MTQYLTQLFRRDAPKTLEEVEVIKLKNERFDYFIKVSSQEEPLSDKIVEASKKLDKKGF